MSTQHSAHVGLTRPRTRRIVESTAFAFLALVITPQAILRALSGHGYSSLGFVALAGLAVLVILGLGLYHMTQVVPKTAGHRLVATYISDTAALASAATLLVAHVLLVGIAAGLAISSLRAFIDFHGNIGIAHAVFVLIMALPVIFNIKIHERILGAVLVLGVLSVVAMIGTALAIETWGSGTWTTMVGFTLDFTPIEVSFSRNFPIFSALLAACMPVAVMGMMTERNFNERLTTRIGIPALAKLVVPVVLLIFATLYLAGMMGLSGQYYGTPVQYMANVVFGETGRRIVAVIGFLAAVAAALATYQRLPGYLRSLASTGMIPRHIAAADERGPRRLVIGCVALICAACMSAMRSTLGISHMLVVVVMVSYALSMTSMVLRARRILGTSTIPEDRQKAKASILYAGACLVVSLVVIIIGAASNVLMAGASFLAIVVPTLVLVLLRRGRGKLIESLTPDDLSAGRTLPTRVHALVLIRVLDRPALQAISYARATRPSSLTTIIVDVDPEMTTRLVKDWDESDLPVDLKILGTPRGAAREPVIDYIRTLRSQNPRDICIVYIPRLVSANASLQRYAIARSTPRLVRELRLEPGVVVAEVPYSLEDNIEHD